MAAELETVTVAAENLEVCYGEHRALNIAGLNLCGNIIGLIGHNGSGKSTLIKTILELLPPRSGRLAVSAAEQAGARRLVPEEDMAFSPEKGAVFEDLEVESYLRLWCRLKCGEPEAYKHGGRAFFEKLDVGPLLKKLGRELSKGERQRVQALLGFVIQPRLFLFDEPFDGLDIRQSSELSALMREESSRTAIIVSSHRMEVVERVADHVIVLREGEVAASGTVSDVCARLCTNSHSVIPEDHNLPLRDLSAALKQTFPGCIVQELGSQVSVFGADAAHQALAEFCRQHFPGRVRIEKVAPSLLDAMNYYLRVL